MNNRIPGILLATGIGLFAFFVAKLPFLPVSPVLLALIIGIGANNLVKVPDTLKPGIKFSGKRILEIAIVFLGFGSSFQTMSSLGWQTIVLLVLLIVAVLLFTVFFFRFMRSSGKSCMLVGFGTAICGSSAIVAVSESLGAKKEETAISIATVNLLGLVGMVTMPLILNNIAGVSDVHSAMVIGGSLQAVGNVAGAGYAVNDAVGNLAVTVKLGRVALLAPAIILFSFLTSSKPSFREHFKLPYYIWGFIAASLLVSFVDLPENVLTILKTSGKILLTISMAGIGLGISLKSLVQNGVKAFSFGIIMFAVQIILVILLMLLFL